MWEREREREREREGEGEGDEREREHKEENTQSKLEYSKISETTERVPSKNFLRKIPSSATLATTTQCPTHYIELLLYNNYGFNYNSMNIIRDSGERENVRESVRERKSVCEREAWCMRNTVVMCLELS